MRIRRNFETNENGWLAVAFLNCIDLFEKNNSLKRQRKLSKIYKYKQYITSFSLKLKKIEDRSESVFDHSDTLK